MAKTITMKMMQDFCDRTDRDFPVPVKEHSPLISSSSGGMYGVFDLDRFMTEHNITGKPSSYEGGVKYDLDACVFDSTHVDGDAAIFQEANGKLKFHCFHDSCAQKGWKDVRTLFDPGYPARRDNVIPMIAPSVAKNAPAGRALLVTQRLSEIESRPIDWFWQDRIPRNEPSLIAGPPGVGKSFVVGALVTAITTGETPPGGGDVLAPGDVLVLALEDDASRVLRSRYEDMGADLRRVHIIQGVSDGHDRVAPFTLHHIEALERKIDELPDVVMVVIDPVSGLMGGADTHRSNEVRERLDPFLDLMNRRSITTLFVTHTNKSITLAGASRVEGSYGGFVGRARAVLGVGRDPESGVHGVGVLKSNYGRTDVPVIGFEIDEGRFGWRAEALSISAAELFEQVGNDQQQSEMSEAREAITGALFAADLSADDLHKAARKEGVSDITFRRARAKMKKEGVIKRAGGGKHGPIRWSYCESPFSIESHHHVQNLIHNDEPENPSMRFYGNEGGVSPVAISGLGLPVPLGEARNVPPKASEPVLPASWAECSDCGGRAELSPGGLCEGCAKPRSGVPSRAEMHAARRAEEDVRDDDAVEL
jgi:hypothetical protein